MKYFESLDWTSIDKALRNFGFVKLPVMEQSALKEFQLTPSSAYECNNQLHLAFLEANGVSALREYALRYAVEHYGLSSLTENEYHVIRTVNPGDKEAYRTHYDSHVLTLVIPYVIPNECTDAQRGELHFLPKNREMPKNQLLNLAEKIFEKRYAGKAGFRKFLRLPSTRIESFSDMEPILFEGIRTLHVNNALGPTAESARITLCSHFNDPYGGHSASGIIRGLRRR